MATLPASHQTRNPSLPFILDENFEYLRAELLGDSGDTHSGLVAEVEGTDELLSMSGYGKSQYSDGKEFDTTRAMEDPMYLSYAQPGTSHVSLQHQIHTPHSRSDQIAYSAGSLYPRQRPMSEVSSTYTPVRSSHQIPEVQHWEPQHGPGGLEMVIRLLSTFELNPTWNFYATFGRHKTSCSIAHEQDHASYHSYVVRLRIPPFQETNWTQNHVPVGLQATDHTGNIVAGPKVGYYTYTDVGSHSALSSPDMSRKRKMASDVHTESAPKRMSAGPSAPDRQTYAYNEGVNYLHHPTMGVMESQLGAQISPPYQAEQATHATHTTHTQRSPVTSLARRASPHPPPLNLTLAHQHSRNLHIATSSGQGLMAVASPAVNPPLVRTSSLQQSPSPAGTPTGVGPSTFNPYKLHPHKASLNIRGDLKDMATGWSEEEQQVQRRLVQFHRTQEGGVIHASFKAVTPEQKLPSEPCISCIWWEAKGECYVTSVDTILLLETLITGRFTVEEKNRIRRNLEGFKPLTVSKGNAESEAFFKLIMGFSAPKPRNIEKDVKAFPWSTLDVALKKIISKYSASFASTLGPLEGGAHATNYRTGYESEHLRHDTYHPGSPYGDVSESAVNTPYAQTIAMNAGNSRINVSQYSGTESSQAITLPSAHTAEYPLYQYPGSAHIPSNTGLGLPIMAVQGHQGQQPTSQGRSWDYEAYVEHGGSSGVGDAALYAMPAGQESGQYGLHASSGT